MTISNFDAVFYTLSFIVPGFIWDSVLAGIIPRKTEGKESLFLRYFTLSCLNYALWVWLIYLLPRLDFFKLYPLRSALSWVLIISVSPFILGMVSGKLRSDGWFRGFLMRIGINSLHPIPSAWDYYFSITSSVWILVTLKDGKQVAGLFGSRSFASSDQNERDLYIQEIYKIKEDGPWQKIPDNNGIFIKGDEIKHIEFWNN